MKKYIKYYMLSIFVIFAIAELIVFIILSKNQPSMPDYVISKFTDLSTQVENWNNSSHSFLSNSYFWMSYLGLSNFISLCDSSSWGFCIVDLLVLLPILGGTIIIIWGQFLLKFIFQKMRRVDLLNLYKIINILWRCFVVFTLFTLLINIIIVEFFESTSNADPTFTEWYGQPNGVIEINGKNIILDSLRLFSTIIQYEGLKNFKSTITSPFNGSMIYITIVLPIFTFLSVFIFTIYLSCWFTLSEYNLGVGRRIIEIKKWLRYKNIASKKEVFNRYFSSLFLIIIIFTFILSLIFPSWIAVGFSQKTGTYIFLFVFTILLFISGFVPTYIILFKVQKMQPANYNFYIFLQYIILFSIGFVWQIIIWIFLNNTFIYSDYVPLLCILFYSILSLISYYLFIYSKK